jgi:hypothetical protein
MRYESDRGRESVFWLHRGIVSAGSHKHPTQRWDVDRQDEDIQQLPQAAPYRGSARRQRWSRAAAALVARVVTLVAALACPDTGDAQGVSTAGIRGTVSAPPRPHIDARIRVSHDATGYMAEAHLTNGRFFIPGLEPGGPYTVTVRALGFVPRRVERVTLALGEMRQLDIVLEPIAAKLDSVAVVADRAGSEAQGRADGGTGTTITESMLERLPTLNRDLYDFVRLVPQVSTRIGLPNPGLSAGSAGFRSNNFLINGVSERTLSGGVSNTFGGVRSIPLEAVQEYQVLIAPSDVR